jgi:short-subunit dehydrogenase
MTLPFQRALITGASAGIGEEFVHQLSRAGIPCVLVARRGDRLEQLAEQYSTCEVLVADLLTAEGIARVAQRLASPTLPVDLLVNNAGFGSSGTFLSVPVNNSTGQIDLNVRALVELSHAALHAFQERKRGYLLNVSSVASFQSGPGMAVYAATKAFIQSFAEGLEREMKPFGVSVLAASPGPVNTGFAKRAKMTMNGAIAVDKIGVPILRALGNRRNVLPGFKTKFLIYSLRTVPRFFKIKIMEKIMKGFSK